MNDQTAAALADLLHADRELIGMYDDAVVRLSSDTSGVLGEAIDDHRRHETLLTEALQAAEMQIVEPGEDMRLLMEEHRSRLRIAEEETDVLAALMLAERLNALLYENAEREDLPEELADLVAEHHADERLHAQLISQRLPETSAQPEHPVACMTGGMTNDVNPDDFD